MSQLTPQQRNALRVNIADHFALEDLRILCFDLGVTFDDLAGEGLSAKARSLIEWFEDRNRIGELIEKCRRERPMVKWEPVPESVLLPNSPPKRFWLTAVRVVALLTVIVAAVIIGGKVARSKSPKAIIPQLVETPLVAESTPAPSPTAPQQVESPIVAGVTSALPSTAGPTLVPSTPTPVLGIGSTVISPKDGMVLVYVPAGEFLRGSAENDPDAEKSEKPQRSVYLDAYWIDQAEVTWGQYQKCVAAGQCKAPLCPNFNNMSYPQHCVSWFNASDYCAWAGRQLPTEAQWEKAARGTDGDKYPWGNDSPSCARLNYGGQDTACVGLTTEVGSYPKGKSPYGALDMAGNLWEWTADWYDEYYYLDSPTVNPKGPDRGGGEMDCRVVRGGSFENTARDVRAAVRRWYSPGNTDNYVGFRCALSD